MRVVSSFILLTFVAIVATTASAQETWEEKKAAHFKPITDDQRATIAEAIPRQATATPKRQRRVLVFYRCEGFIHTSIPHGNLAMQEMARQTGAFEVDLADTYDVFAADNLKQYDCVLLNNTTHMKFPSSDLENAFLDFVASGKGLVGFHAASDNFGDHPRVAFRWSGESSMGTRGVPAAIGRSNWMIPSTC